MDSEVTRTRLQQLNILRALEVASADDRAYEKVWLNLRLTTSEIKPLFLYDKL